MSVGERRLKRQHRETGAMQILEEAFHLVRSTDLTAFLVFYLGAIPWALGLLYFVADMSRSSFANRDAAFAALILAILALWMRFCQARYCESLWRELNPGYEPTLRGWTRFRGLVALWLIQSLRLPLLAFGLFFAIPLGWIIATLQNAAVLAFTQKPDERPLRTLFARSLRYSHDQWAQNHGILIVFFFVSIFTWINLIASCLFVPAILKAIFGVESVFTLSPAVAVMNTTFLLGSFLLMQLAISPLLNAAYVLRCFYAGSRESGADLLSRLATCRTKREEERRRERGALGRVALCVCLLLPSFAFPSLRAEEERLANPSSLSVQEDSDRFRTSITKTLEQKKYQWRLSRRDLQSEGDEDQSWLEQRLTEIAESAKHYLKSIEDWIEGAIRKLINRGGVNSPRNTGMDSEFFKNLGSVTSIALVIVVFSLLLGFAWILVRRHRNLRKVEDFSDEGIGVIDLESEDIVATQLREDEWLRLAREQIGKGDERLAIRALFLATLAHLGERGLIRIARFKSNRDYRQELSLRARQSETLRAAFAENTILFERVWYGMHRLEAGTIDLYLENHGSIVEASATAESARLLASSSGIR